MLKILIISVFLVFYTYLLKRRFKVKMMEAWRAEKVGSEIMVYIMIVLPACPVGRSDSVFWRIRLKNLIIRMVWFVKL